MHEGISASAAVVGSAAVSLTHVLDGSTDGEGSPSSLQATGQTKVS